MRDHAGATPLMLALHGGRPDLASLILAHPNVDKYARGHKGETALTHAASCSPRHGGSSHTLVLGDPDLISLVWETNGEGQTPFYVAARMGYPDMVRALLETRFGARREQVLAVVNGADEAMDSVNGIPLISYAEEIFRDAEALREVLEGWLGRNEGGSGT
ncbi:uncharacterized protein BDV14DRAFT_198911 [Aspergillus stella-maris]|uniref:uncharacterized protein n=1 Tax=Aspergillus stella-maris TaxID=1810926 RepID=UPI003CCC9B4E